MARYRSIADDMRQAILSGAYNTSPRLPSVRVLAKREAVSLATAAAALRSLEGEGLIVAKPRSGFVLATQTLSEPGISRPSGAPQDVSMAGLARTIFANGAENLVPLGAALPCAQWLPTKMLNRALASAGRRLGASSQSYSMPPGRLALRQQIAARAAADWGARFGADDVLITSGVTEAVRLALSAVTKPGDIVAVESPAYFGHLLQLESLGLQALEIATHPRTGLDVEAFARVIRSQRVVAAIVSPVISNPLGAVMPNNARAALVALAEQHQITLIEDDIYGDLVEPGPLRTPLKALDRTDSVIYCSSVSKTLAPGWRIGWVVGGKHHANITRKRLDGALAGSPVIEAALADFLLSGDHDRHLRRLRQRVSAAVQAIAGRVAATFPDGTRFSLPDAGYLLWIDLPEHVDALAVHRRAADVGIGISPGHLFSPSQRFSHHVRINCANEPTPRLLLTIDRLGALCF